jgi:plasmid maintenance system antidote protein VapI
MQRGSTHSLTGEQLSFLPKAGAVSRPVSIERIQILSDTHEALSYGCELGKLAPKQIYGDMGIDKSTWSRIVNGEWDLDGRDILRFDRLVGNDAYLWYLIHIHGYDLASLRTVQDDKDRRIAELERTVADQDRALRLLFDHQQGRR